MRRFDFHDPRRLLQRWHKVARLSRLEITTFGQDGGFDVVALQNRAPVSVSPRLYLSAGIHGDEAAATEGLVTWAEENIAILRSMSVHIFPCLNPWGLANNCRADSKARDLNRCYHNRRVPIIRAQSALLLGRRYDLAMMLHEDYDAHGAYLYEVNHRRASWAPLLLAAAQAHVQIDARSRIEGQRARSGVIRRRVTRDFMPHWPEAFLLHFQHSARTYTFETPSECDIAQRVAAHVAVLGKAMQLSVAEL